MEFCSLKVQAGSWYRGFAVYFWPKTTAHQLLRQIGLQLHQKKASGRDQKTYRSDIQEKFPLSGKLFHKIKETQITYQTVFLVMEKCDWLVCIKCDRMFVQRAGNFPCHPFQIKISFDPKEENMLQTICYNRMAKTIHLLQECHTILGNAK